MGSLITKTPRKVGRPRKRVGRPPAVTEQTVDKLIYAFGIGCTDAEACLYANISVTTLFKFIDKNPLFAQKRAQLKDNPVLLARQTVVKALKTDVDTAKWYLERRAKGEFSTKTEQDVNVNVVFNNGIPRPKELKADATYSVPKVIEGEVVDK